MFTFVQSLENTHSHVEVYRRARESCARLMDVLLDQAIGSERTATAPTNKHDPR